MSWLPRWEPENEQFWRETGSRIAWRPLILTTITLILSFMTWFVMSPGVIRLPKIGFRFSSSELFWLAAMPGLAGGTLRILHTFLIPIFGTRLVVGGATLLKIIPCVGLGLAGAMFPSFMRCPTLFFPKRLQGAALGIQAGMGNFGVTPTQLVTPWI